MKNDYLKINFNNKRDRVMVDDEEYQIESWVSSLSSIEKPEKIPLEYIRRYLQEVYKSIERTIHEDTLLDHYFEFL